MISKPDLRKQLIIKRKMLNTKELSDLICKNIVKTELYQNAKNIFAYYPMKYEVDITPLFKDNSKVWFLPKVFGEEMNFYEYKTGDDLAKSNFGVLEPTKNDKIETNADLIIVPALSVDKNNFRLGYGKGFYDRFLSKYKSKTLTPIFSELITDILPIQEHDKKIDLIITEK